jgi:hypothetical protein
MDCEVNGVVARDVKTVEPVVQGKGEIAQDPGLPGRSKSPGRKQEAVGTGRVPEIVKVLDKGVLNNVVIIIKNKRSRKSIPVSKQSDNQKNK